VTRLRVATAALALAALGGGIAYAAIPDAAGVIHGCRTLAGGTLRVIDSEAGQTCRSSEAALNWNQTGPQGPQGPAGTAKAWARIGAAGNIAHSFGLGSATVSHPRTGVYCIHNLPFQPHVAVATAPTGLQSDGAVGIMPEGYDVNVTAGTLDIAANPGVVLGFCDPDTGPATAQVRVYVANPNGLFDRGFSIFIDG
jgi:hypothetical protein